MVFTKGNEENKDHSAGSFHGRERREADFFEKTRPRTALCYPGDLHASGDEKNILC